MDPGLRILLDITKLFDLAVATLITPSHAATACVLPEGCLLSPIPPCTHSPHPPGIVPSLVSEPAKLGDAEAKAKGS